MGRFRKKRNCRHLGAGKIYKPAGIPARDLTSVTIAIDEFEAMRICDLEGKSQIETGEIMDISRATVQRLLHSGRSKTINAMLHNMAIIIEKE
jgi:predicted DNA-binding protein (UPF0251 family)